MWKLAKKAEGSTLEEKLDSVFPGEWDVTFEFQSTSLTPTQSLALCKARLQILGVVREAVADIDLSPASASAVAFERAANRFGIRIS